MNKKFPYEEELKRKMGDIEVPGEDEAWQKMKVLLDENDKRRPLAFFKNYKALSALLIIACITIGLLIHETNRKFDRPLSATQTNLFTKEKPLTLNDSKVVQPSLIQQQNNIVINSPKASDSSNKLRDKNIHHPLNSSTIERQITTPGLAKENNPLVEPKKSITSKQRNNTDTSTSVVTQGEKGNAFVNNQAKQNADASLSDNTLNSLEKTHSNQPETAAKAVQVDSILIGQKLDAVAKANIAAKDLSLSKKAILKNKLTLSAGVGVQQQIPVSGQQSFSYGYKGTANTLSDYIPSLFIRLEKEHQWFLQAEYMYSSPQLIRSFSYNRQTIIDYSASTITTTNYHLRKTFYSQIPVSFNYFVQHNLSVGAGLEYNRFLGAISEKEVTTKNVAAQTQTTTKQVVPMAAYTDSFLYRSHLYLLLQTDYNWQRLSLGIRYSKDLQPYIKYTMPNGTIANEKNWALECILRFKLFTSRNLKGSR